MTQRVMCDLFCGTRYGWTKGFVAHGWHCIGIDILPVVILSIPIDYLILVGVLRLMR